jgi:1-pyrroline-5-carboxylate dehydrogenase
MTTSSRVTYVSLGASPELDAAFDEALAAVRAALPLRVTPRLAAGRLPESRQESGLASGGAGQPGLGVAAPDGGPVEPLYAPYDRELLVAEVVQASAAEAAVAMAQAHAAFPAWRARPWPERVAILRRAADRIGERRLELAAWMMFEIGKTRLEALAEVEESADLLRYYCDRMEAEDGYRRPMARLSPAEATESVLLPFGAWAVIAPFNFPSALAAGMVAGALVTGNTVVLKPAEAAPISPALLCRALWDAGVPQEVLQLVPGTGEEVGRALVGDPHCAGVAFTGSYDVGMQILAQAAAGGWQRPVVAEMGGKNACVVTARGDVAAAAVAAARSAFGFAGQKCSACSRAYVEASVYPAFVAAVAAAARSLPVGAPFDRTTFVGPVVDARAVARFRRAVEAVVAAGGEILAGGRVLADSGRDGDLARGFYVEPTVASLPDPRHPLFRDELFLPFLLVHPVPDLDAALALANDSRFGLTAGLFSADPAEVERFLEGIEAGVVYVNRRSGATTGAWPGVNPFGGWKGSGSTGPAALGPHYLLRFLREQSRAVSGVAGWDRAPG